MDNECKDDNAFNLCFQSALIRNIEVVCEEHGFSAVFILGSHVRYTVEDKIEPSNTQNSDEGRKHNNKDIELGGSLKVLWQFNNNIVDENFEKCDIKDFGVMLSRPYKIKALLPYAISNRCIVYKCFHCEEHSETAYKLEQSKKDFEAIKIHTPGFDVVFDPLGNSYAIIGVPIDFGVEFYPGQLPTPIIAVFLRLINPKDQHTCPPTPNFENGFVKSIKDCNNNINQAIEKRIKEYPISHSQGKQAKKLLLLHMPKRIWAVVMFADIRNFSRISKTLLANLGATEEYIAKLYKVAIDEFEKSRFGYINKFIGDGFMAVFPVLSSEVGGVIKECTRTVPKGINCPIIAKEKPTKGSYYTAYKSYEEDNVPGYIIKDAMKTALRIARKADTINTTMKSIRLEDEKKDIKMVVGFGLHYSYIFHSEVTSADGEILDFTALGDGVNAASRYGDCGAREWFYDNEGRKNYYYIAMSDTCKDKVKNLLHGPDSFRSAKHETKSGKIEYYYYEREGEIEP